MPISKMIKMCPFGATNKYNISTPIGDMILTSCPKGVHSLGIVEGMTDENFQPNLNVYVKLLSQDNGDMYKPATQAIDWLQTYFKGQGSNKELVPPEICTHIGKEGTFTHTAWFTALQKVPFGETVSYQSLARLCGNARACRAVGQAMSNNPVGLIIPCHRVIQENGGLGNYHHGTRNKTKQWLLKHEGVLK